jgi:cytochrome c-type biogenesis protein CcmF
MPLLAFGLAAFVAVVTLRELFLPAQQRMRDHREDLATALLRSATRSQRRFGGYVVHLGIVVLIVGVAASSAYKAHATGTVRPGESLTVGDWKVRFDGMTSGREPHREYVAANLTLIAPWGEEIQRHDEAAPRMNYYERSNDPIGSPSVRATFLRDVYVSLLTFDNKAGTASFNAWVFPLVGWIWYVAIPILVLGTLIALWPQRKQRAAEAGEPARVVVEGSTP